MGPACVSNDGDLTANARAKAQSSLTAQDACRRIGPLSPRVVKPRPPLEGRREFISNLPTWRIHMRNRLHAFALLPALLFATPALAVTWNVPVDFPTIQQAINASSSGDVIIVAPGVYPENIVV